MRMEFRPRPHPSGRPIERSRYTELPFKRHVHDEPLTPGLKPGRERTEAFGFIASFDRQEIDE